ncbi:MAG: hypothetical protein KC502_17865 [Myxococcales bacterium]|nr:hypothetical protein [Myxococcales bacterium]
MTLFNQATAARAAVGLLLIAASCAPATDGQTTGGASDIVVAKDGSTALDGLADRVDAGTTEPTSDAASEANDIDDGSGAPDSLAAAQDAGEGEDATADAASEDGATEDGIDNDGEMILCPDAGELWDDTTGAPDSEVSADTYLAADSVTSTQGDGTVDGGTEDAPTADVNAADAQSSGDSGDSGDSVGTDTQDTADGDASGYGPPPLGPSVWNKSATQTAFNGFGGPPESNDIVIGPPNTALLCTSLKGLHAVDIGQPNQLLNVASSGFSQGSSFAPKCHRVTTALIDGQWRVWVTWRGDNHQPTPTVTELLYDTTGAQPVLSESSHVTMPGGSVEGLVWHANKLWVANHNKGLVTLKRKGGKLVKSGTVSGLKNAWDVAAMGAHVAIADGTAGLAVVEATPAQTIVGKLGLGGLAMRVVTEPQANRAFIAAAEGGLFITDLTIPAQPQLLAQWSLPSPAVDVSLAGSRLFVAAIDHVYGVDVSVPAKPKLFGAFRNKAALNGASYHLAVATDGKQVLTAEWNGLSAWKMAPKAAAPALVVTTRKVVLSAPVGQTAYRDLTLHNAGNRWLTINSATVKTTSFNVVQAAKTIAPGASAIVRVAFAPQAKGAVSDVLELNSDDPQQPLATIALTGLVASGGPKAPAIAVTVPGGTVWKSTDHAGKVRLISYFSTFCPMAWHTASTTHRSLNFTFPTSDFVLVAAAAAPKDVGAAILPTDSPSQVKRYVDVLELPFTVGFDTGGGKMSLVPGTKLGAPAPVPVDVLIGRDGRVLRVEPRFDTGGLMSDIEAALAEPAP